MSWLAAGVGFILLVVVGTAPAASSGPSLDCTNDLQENITCTFKAQNCSEYSLTLQRSDENKKEQGVFQQCDHPLCCCSIRVDFVYGQRFNATVWKGNNRVGSTYVYISASIKPKAPTIESLRESNGIIELKWKSNVQSRTLESSLTANVTYYRRGHREKQVTKHVESVKSGDLYYYEIPGRDLEPSTTYVFSVRSHTSLSGKYSDSSEEREFTTAASSHPQPLVAIVTLSAAAVVITMAVISCYYRIRVRWSDTLAKCPEPKLSLVFEGMEKGKPSYNVVTLLPTDFSCVSVDPAAPADGDTWSNCGSREQRAQTSSGSPSLSWDGVEPVDAFAPSDRVVQPSASTPYIPPAVRADDSSPGATGFNNMTYFNGISCRPRVVMTQPSEVDQQAETACDESQPQVWTQAPTASNHQSSTNSNPEDCNPVYLMASQ